MFGDLKWKSYTVQDLIWKQFRKIQQPLFPGITYLFAFTTMAGSSQHMPKTVGPYNLTHPAKFPRGRKPEYPEKTHDFLQSVDLYPFESSTKNPYPTHSVQCQLYQRHLA